VVQRKPWLGWEVDMMILDSNKLGVQSWDDQNYDGNTPLIIACSSKSVQTVQILTYLMDHEGGSTKTEH